MPFYAVSNGREIGIFNTWNECNNSIKGFSNALYKKFDTIKEAEDFIINNKKIINNNYIDFNPDYYVYTDGACLNNGKENTIAGIGIFFNINDERNLSKKLDGKQTNNSAELNAIIEAYHIIENDIKNGKKIIIVTDSEYSMKCISYYGEKLHQNNYNLDIPNKELVKKIYDLYKDKSNVKFIHIKAHTNKNDIHSIGNYNADKLANEALGLNISSYNVLEKIYLNIPFSKKDEIKKYGGMWDSNKKKWFVYENNKEIDNILLLFEKE